MEEADKVRSMLTDSGLWFNVLTRIEHVFADVSNIVIAPLWYGLGWMMLMADAMLHAKWRSGYCTVLARSAAAAAGVNVLPSAGGWPPYALEALRRYISHAGCRPAVIIEDFAVGRFRAHDVISLAGEYQDVLFMVQAPLLPSNDFKALITEPSVSSLLWYGGPGGAEGIRSAVVAMTAAVYEASRRPSLRGRAARRKLAEITGYLLDTGLASEVGGVIAGVAPNPLDALSIYADFLMWVYDSLSNMRPTRVKYYRMRSLHGDGTLKNLLKSSVDGVLTGKYLGAFDLLLGQARAYFGQREVDEVVAAAAAGRARTGNLPQEKGKVVTALRNLGIIYVKDGGAMALTPTFASLIAYSNEFRRAAQLYALEKGLESLEEN